MATDNLKRRSDKTSDNNSESRKIEIEHDTLYFLNITRKWSMFLAILGFIVLGLLLMIGLVTGTFLSVFNAGGTGTGIPEVLIIVLCLVLSVIYFFPGYFLVQFSKHTANAFHTFDKQELHKAFKNLKSYFVYTGVLIIFILILYIVVLVATGTSMSFLKAH
jgi:hypothetical protein